MVASNDGGIGIAAGLGYQFYDKDGNILPACGQSLLNLAVSTENRYEIPDVHVRIFGRPRWSTYVVLKSCDHHFWQTKGRDTTMFAVIRSSNPRLLWKISPAALEIKGAGAGGGTGGLCALLRQYRVNGDRFACLEFD